MNYRKFSLQMFCTIVIMGIVLLFYSHNPGFPLIWGLIVGGVISGVVALGIDEVSRG